MAVIMLKLQGTYYIDTVFVYGDVWVLRKGINSWSFGMVSWGDGLSAVCEADVLKTTCPELWEDACAIAGTKPEEEESWL